MPTERLANDAQTTVATAYAAGSATMIVADATRLPTLSGGDQFRITCYTPLSPTNLEILIVTAVTGNLLSVSPAAEPIAGIQTPFAHPVGDVVANAITVDSLSAVVAGAIASTPDYETPNASGAAIQAGSPVATHATGVGVVPATSADNNANAVGLAIETVASSSLAKIRTGGVLSLPDWTPVVGSAVLAARAVYFLGATPGTLTTSAPTSGVVQAVARAVSPDSLEIFIQPTILL